MFFDKGSLFLEVCVHYISNGLVFQGSYVKYYFPYIYLYIFVYIFLEN